MADINFRTLKDSVIQPGQLTAGGSTSSNLALGGQWGAFPKPGHKEADGKVSYEWTLSDPYVRNNMIVKVLDIPKFIWLLPDAEKRAAMFRSIFETCAIEVSGLDGTLNVSSSQHAFSADGNEYYTPVRTYYNQSKPSFKFKERGNRDIGKFLDDWILYGIGDPLNQIPRAQKFLKQVSPEDIIKDPYGTLEQVNGRWGVEMFTCSMLFFEPDVTNRNVITAFLCVNMYPEKGGEKTGGSNRSQDKQTLDIDVTFNPITWHHTPVEDFARHVLASMTSVRQDPNLNMTLPIANPNADVVAEKYSHNIETMQDNDITMDNGQKFYTTDPLPAGK